MTWCMTGRVRACERTSFPPSRPAEKVWPPAIPHSSLVWHRAAAVGQYCTGSSSAVGRGGGASRFHINNMRPASEREAPSKRDGGGGATPTCIGWSSGRHRVLFSSVTALPHDDRCMHPRKGWPMALAADYIKKKFKMSHTTKWKNNNPISKISTNILYHSTQPKHQTKIPNIVRSPRKLHNSTSSLALDCYIHHQMEAHLKQVHVLSSKSSTPSPTMPIGHCLSPQPRCR